ncbi:MAG: molybdopterin-synthase adenylyltransferase MoeB [Rhodospirillaceae bacterium]|nr:molybdopterin-synthase adenylyltransferase MoeB [Rhodospirillaceae bacterium]MBT5243082.1 molybdopterin-synthase adenylyltransferase MoeB [Rhodospirillaceae bacterium]MBT5563307.1 molybdopterin-synthase adenylyltransferase MoeB [Rhodospirillaceae bacterium]MBT6243621.1 molybdopterin-synthase adenylyltransferase MoeB [Rhodospirillaceae bacterium]MBT7136447.1 molybdopterin-synthase adenylyltransferase MoeB [Rhodospirillaceae bacterium]
MDFNEQQIQRYARHILLDHVGGAGQSKLLESKVLVVGAGGLGSPVLLYLAAAGVGTIGVIDDDRVDLSNLQRQIVHSTASVGMAKVESAKKTIAAINPEVNIAAHNERISADNALELIGDYDLVADGSDNFATRFLVNDACYFAKKTLVSAAILRFDGQVYTFKPHQKDADGHALPCYRCLFPEAPPPGQIPSCAEAGVLGALCGTIGSLQATEIIKELLGIGDSLAGSLMIYEGLSSEFRKIRVKADPGCPLCGESPKITDLSGHKS